MPTHNRQININFLIYEKVDLKKKITGGSFPKKTDHSLLPTPKLKIFHSHESWEHTV